MRQSPYEEGPLNTRGTRGTRGVRLRRRRPGVDPVDLPFIFDRFYRSQAARGTQGVGLGHAIARGLVEAQGGVIEAADSPEGGAVFTVRLPAAG